MTNLLDLHYIDNTNYFSHENMDNTKQLTCNTVTNVCITKISKTLNYGNGEKNYFTNT